MEKRIEEFGETKMAEGETKRARAIATSLIQTGYLNDSQIAEITEISSSEIKEIRKKLALQASILI